MVIVWLPVLGKHTACILYTIFTRFMQNFFNMKIHIFKSSEGLKGDAKKKKVKMRLEFSHTLCQYLGYLSTYNISTLLLIHMET